LIAKIFTGFFSQAKIILKKATNNKFWTKLMIKTGSMKNC